MAVAVQRLAYLVDGNGAGIVLVAALGVHQLRHEGILPAIAGRAGRWRRRQVVAVNVERNGSLAGSGGLLGALSSHCEC